MPSEPNLRTNVLLHSEETGGHLSVTEIVVSPHTAGPPLHTHDFDKAFYMLEGELIFQVEDALVTKVAGELSFALRHVAHTLAKSQPRARALPARLHARGLRAPLGSIPSRSGRLDPPEWALAPIPEITVLGPAHRGSGVSTAAAGAQ